MKVTVCSGCDTIMTSRDKHGNPVCPICLGIYPNSGIPKEIDAQPTAHCIDCNQEATYVPEENVWFIGDDKKAPHNSGYRNMKLQYLPFHNIRNGTFYCGCYGWD